MRKVPERGLIVSKIRNGTVIDHITAGEALNVLRILGITGSTTETLSVATNVESRYGKKDIVKIEKRELCKEEVDRIALIAPKATINIIRNYEVFDKKGVSIPELLIGVVRCPNPECISNTQEPIESKFEVLESGVLRCMYCGWRVSRVSKDLTGCII
ncbi:MAG TPA: aspartate carbamoyltransferase regulatory subunit [Methanomicrobiales archaeon]|nr:aspartate carbamoyltransferase regulatory subunit [Methanomicrobiales archaeon]